jgi:hypothetical protein
MREILAIGVPRSHRTWVILGWPGALSSVAFV